MNPAHIERDFYASILYNGAPWKGQTLYTYEGCNDGYALGGGTTCTGYYMRKLFDENLPKNGIRATDLTYYYMRYAEVLLIYAEAMAEQGDIPAALEALNEVRARVDLPAKSAKNKTEFMKLLRHERMIELAFEGHRFWDIRRWKEGDKLKSIVQMKITKNDDGTFTYTRKIVNRSWDDKMYLFPIPQSERMKNPNLTQNPGWE